MKQSIERKKNPLLDTWQVREQMSFSAFVSHEDRQVKRPFPEARMHHVLRVHSGVTMGSAYVWVSLHNLSFIYMLLSFTIRTSLKQCAIFIFKVTLQKELSQTDKFKFAGLNSTWDGPWTTHTCKKKINIRMMKNFPWTYYTLMRKSNQNFYCYCLNKVCINIDLNRIL